MSRANASDSFLNFFWGGTGGGENGDLVEKIVEKISSRFKQVFAVKGIGQSPSPSHLLILKIHHLSGSLACKGRSIPVTFCLKYIL
jgi:hypothetical protein